MWYALLADCDDIVGVFLEFSLHSSSLSKHMLTFALARTLGACTSWGKLERVAYSYALSTQWPWMFADGK